MWTSLIQSVTPNSAGNYTFVVVYTNNGKTVTEKYDVSDSTSLNTIVAQRLNALNGVDASVAQTPIGPFTPTPPTVNAGQIAFMAALRLLEQYQQVITLGVLTASDPGYQAALTNAQKAFNPSYFS